jgi:glycosyltransferase involved in cell wall biosynthesis
MTGGEAYTFENENYKYGIGQTPYLHVPPLCNPILDRRQHFIELKKDLYSKIQDKIHFVSDSKWLEDCFKSSYVFNLSLKTQTIYGGYDDTIFFEKKRDKSTLLRVLIFNSSSPFKGSEIFKQLLETIQIPFELNIVGGDIDTNNKNIAKKIVHSYISDRQKLAELYNSIDILVFPSKAEVLGLLPIEAMACGVCVFASNIGGIPEFIEHNRNGFLFNNVNELSNLLNKNMLDSSLIYETGKNAANDVKYKFTNSMMIDKYNELYLSIMNSF